jgi:hypothetical protein
VVDERHQTMARLARGYGKRNGKWQDIGYSIADVKGEWSEDRPMAGIALITMLLTRLAVLHV